MCSHICTALSTNNLSLLECWLLAQALIKIRQVQRAKLGSSYMKSQNAELKRCTKAHQVSLIRYLVVQYSNKYDKIHKKTEGHPSSSSLHRPFVIEREHGLSCHLDLSDTTHLIPTGLLQCIVVTPPASGYNNLSEFLYSHLDQCEMINDCCEL